MRAIRTILEVPPGTILLDAHIQAIKYSINNQVNVEYTHDSTTYSIIFNDFLTLPRREEYKPI